MAGREYPARPMVGVGGVVINRDRKGDQNGDQVLLVRRAREPLKGQWSLPGGLVEVGEKLTAAVRREIAEETGLRVRVMGIVEVLDRITHGASKRVKYHYVLVDFLCRVKGGALKASSDVSDARWVRRRDLAKYHLQPATLRVIEKAFQSGPGA